MKLLKLKKTNQTDKDNIGFTLIELLVVISIIGILIAISIFGIQNAKKSARDAKRKSDLESIRSALEMYRADCRAYPIGALPNPIVGTVVLGCGAAMTYMETVPSDPLTTNNYYYSSTDGSTYTLCASLENVTLPVVISLGCGNNCGGTCSYRVTNP